MATYTYKADIDLERGNHVISAQVNNIWQIVTSPNQDLVMAYDLAVHRIDLYQDEAYLDATDIQLQDAMLPDLPQLSFASESLVRGTVTCVVRDRGLYVYRFSIRYVDKAADGTYRYRCEAEEREALTTTQTVLARATSSLDLIRVAAPQLDVVNDELLTQVITEQAFENSTGLDIIGQLLIINECLGHIRNGRLYLLPLDLSSQTARAAMARLDADTAWSRDGAIYDKVRVYYTIKQSPVPGSVLTNYDAANWTGTLVNKTMVDTSLLPAPSGAAYLLKATGNASRGSLSIPVTSFDRFLMNWCPVTASSMTVSLQEDGSNKLEFTRTFGGGTGEGFIISAASATDTATKTIAIGSSKCIMQVQGNTTKPCSWRLTLKLGATVVYQGDWNTTLGTDNLLQADFATEWVKVNPCDTIQLEFQGLYVVGSGYGVQVSQLLITEYLQKSVAIGQHTRLVTRQTYRGSMSKTADSTTTQWNFYGDLGAAPALESGQEYGVYATCPTNLLVWGPGGTLEMTDKTIPVSVTVENGRVIARMTQAINTTGDIGQAATIQVGTVSATLSVYETVWDMALRWETQPWSWGGTSFNLWDRLDIPISQMTRTGSPKTIVTIAITCTGDYYLDSLYFLANDPKPQYVDVGTGSKVYEVHTGEFGSQAAALAYAKGLLEIVSTPKEQYTKRVPLGTDLAVGDVVTADGTNLVIYNAAYDGSAGMVTLAAGRQVDNTLEALKQTVRRLDALEKVIA